MGLSLPWHEPVLAKAVRTVYQRNAVIFQYNRLEAEQPLTQTLLSSCEPSVLSLSGGPTSVKRPKRSLQHTPSAGPEYTQPAPSCPRIWRFSIPRFISLFFKSYARAHVPVYPHTPMRIRTRTHTGSSSKRTEHSRGGYPYSLCPRPGETSGDVHHS